MELIQTIQQTMLPPLWLMTWSAISMTLALAYVLLLTTLYPWPSSVKLAITLGGVAWFCGVILSGALDVYAVFIKFLAVGIKEYGIKEFALRLKGLMTDAGVQLRVWTYVGGLAILTWEAARLSRVFYYRSFLRERYIVGLLKFALFLAGLPFSFPFLLIATLYYDHRWRHVEVVIEGSPVFKDHRMGIFIINWNLTMQRLLDALKTRRIPSAPDFRISDDLTVSRDVVDTGILIKGGPGSGKTNLMFNWCIRPAIKRRERSLVYCYKGDFTAALGEDDDTIIWSLFDKRSYRWAIGHDVNTSNKFLELMWALIATTGSMSKQKFFDSSFVDVATAIFLQLREKHGEAWRFPDLYKAIHDKEEIQKSIDRHRPEAKLLFAGEESGDQTAGIMGTIREKMMSLEPMARAWTDSEMPEFSLSDFLSDDYKGLKKTVVIRVHPQYRSLSQDFVSMALQLSIAIVTSLPDAVGERDINMFLDELQTLGMIPALMELPRVGRSKGFHVYLGTQDFGRTKVQYRDEGGIEGLKNSIGLKLLGLLSGDEAKADAAKMCDTVRIERWQKQQRSGGKNGSSQVEEYTKSVADQPAMVSGAFSLPIPSLTVPASFFLKYGDWPIVQLRYPIKPLPKKYPSLVEAPWIGDFDLLKKAKTTTPAAMELGLEVEGEEEDEEADKSLGKPSEKKKKKPKTPIQKI